MQMDLFKGVPNLEGQNELATDESLSEIIREKLTRALANPNHSNLSKDTIRHLHEAQRRERAGGELTLLRKYGKQLISHFAEGGEINPSKIEPQLVAVRKPDSMEGYVFRMATLFWSVPVSRGYGRRMRYLIIDKQNSKLIGILALGDPVFNLRCRDEWIGWNVVQRRERLAFVLDAYVLGAVPPYSRMLGGKLVASLLASARIRTDFRERYADGKGTISKRNKDPHLVLITTTSALGRSSIYNRLRIPGIVNMAQIGHTKGWGHFLVTDELFAEVRLLLKEYGDPYADNYRFGQGPSWRFRALRKACNLVGLNTNALQHGISREVYAMPLANNWREILIAKQDRPLVAGLSEKEIGKAAVERWVVPRAERNSDWLCWTRKDTWCAMTEYMIESRLQAPQVALET